MSGSQSNNRRPSGISISGPDRADVIVLLHMNGVNRHMWQGVVRLLDDSFRCVTLDFPGFGDLSGQEFTVDSAIDRIRSVADSLEVENMALVGLSLGGYMAQAYTAQRPEGVNGILISGAAVPWTELRGVGFRLFGYLLTLLMPIIDRIGKKRFAESLRNKLDPDIANAIIDGGLSPRTGAQVFRRLPGTDYAQTMTGYSGSLFIVNGENDKIHRRSERRFEELFANPNFIAVADAGHAVPLDQPEVFARAVRKLMDLTD